MAEQQNKGFNLHQNIFNLSESPEVIVDGSGNLIEYNHAFNKLMKLDDNFNHRKIKSINFFKKIINYKPQIKSKFNEIVFHKHLEVNLLDNSKIIADVKISQLFDSQENIVYHCRISDITNELYKYEQVQQSNEILERIFQNTHFMIAYLDIHFNFVRVNKAYAEVENKEPSFFMNKNHFDLYPNVDAERIFQDVVDTKIPFNIEGMPFTYNNNPERGITYWNWSLNPVLNTEGEVIGLLLALVDVSDLKKSEFRLTHRLKFEKLISKINDKFVKSKNFDDTIFHTLEDIQSISKSDDLILFKLTPDLKKIRLKSAWPNPNYISPEKEININQINSLFSLLKAKKLIIFDDQNPLNPENHLMLKYLTEKYIEKGILISVSIDDNCIGLLVINNYDFGENVILEDLLLLKLLGSTLANIFAKQDYEDKYRKQQNLDSLGLLAGGLAHDFNNILTIILGNISLISRSLENTNTSLDKFINSTRLAVSRAKDITKQLLTFSKGGAPIKKITSIEELVVDTTNFHLHGSKVKAEFNIQKGLWLTEIDKNQMSQVISNLVVNATQAMPNGGKISISIENALTNYQHGEMISKNNKFNKITISDTGTGISEEYMDKIFDPYFTTKPMGNGLGLAMVFSIVNKHDGFISVDSIEGVGTKFELYIPAVEIDIKDTVVEKVSNIKEKTKGNILFMDDEDPIRFIIESMLITLGFTAVTVPDGEALIKEYLKSIKLNQKFDLVIMDLIIPGAMGGKETMERLLEIDPDVVALVSSGYSNDPLISNYRDYGFKGVINKPFDLDDLQAIITKIFKYNL